MGGWIESRNNQFPSKFSCKNLQKERRSVNKSSVPSVGLKATIRTNSQILHSIWRLEHQTHYQEGVL
jgi:hypothetical protein